MQRAPRRVILPAAVVLVAIATGLAAAWWLTPLREYAAYQTLFQALGSLKGHPAAPFLVVLLFVAGGLVLFPVSLLVVVTAAVLGPWMGLAVAMAGIMASASVLYVIGRIAGLELLQNVMGSRLQGFQRRIVRNGMMTVALIRLIPFAPFSIVSLIAGVSGIGFADLFLGTALGMTPGLLAMSVFGGQLSNVLTQPSWWSAAAGLVCLSVWIGFSLGVQAVVTRLSPRA